MMMDDLATALMVSVLGILIVIWMFIRDEDK